MIRPALLVLLFAMASCGSRPDETVEPASAEPPASSFEAVSSAMPESTAPTPAVISAEGYGPLRIGMTKAEVIAALGPDANPNAVGGPDEEACDMWRPQRAPEGFLVMIEDGILTSVWMHRSSAVTSDKGHKVGDAAQTVKQTYGAALQAEPHAYSDPPAEYLTVWSTKTRDTPQARGIRYEIGPDGKVESISGGGRSITYVEGCA